MSTCLSFNSQLSGLFFDGLLGFLCCNCLLLALNADETSLIGCCAELQSVGNVLLVDDCWMSFRQWGLLLLGCCDLVCELLLLLSEQCATTGDFGVRIELNELTCVSQWVQ